MADDTETRLARLEGLLLRPRPEPPAFHHPRPGTWEADTHAAQCRTCLRPIVQDQRSGRWSQPGSADPERCQAAAQGAPEHDEHGPVGESR